MSALQSIKDRVAKSKATFSKLSAAFNVRAKNLDTNVDKVSTFLKPLVDTSVGKTIGAATEAVAIAAMPKSKRAQYKPLYIKDSRKEQLKDVVKGTANTAGIALASTPAGTKSLVGLTALDALLPTSKESLPVSIGIDIGETLTGDSGKNNTKKAVKDVLGRVPMNIPKAGFYGKVSNPATDQAAKFLGVTSKVAKAALTGAGNVVEDYITYAADLSPKPTLKSNIAGAVLPGVVGGLTSKDINEELRIIQEDQRGSIGGKGPQEVYRGREKNQIDQGKDGYVFFTDSKDAADKYAEIAKPLAGESEVIKRDISGLKFKDSTKATYLDDVENPEIKSKYDGIKFTEGDSVSYAIFNESLKDQTVKDNQPVSTISPYEGTLGTPDNAGKTVSEIVQKDYSIPEEYLKEGLDAIKNSRDLRAQQDLIYAAERSKRFAASADIRSKGRGEEGALAAMDALRGELTKIDFEAPRLTPEAKDSFYDAVSFSPKLFDEGERTVGTRALRDIFEGKVPTPSGLDVLDRVFGNEFTKTLLDKRPFSEKLTQNVIDVLNIPRALTATLDLSAPFRQGVFFVGKPKQFAPAFINMFKYFGSEKNFNEAMAEIQTRPNYQMMKDNKLALTDMGSNMSKREESFMSNFAERIPGLGRIVKASNRSYTGFLNKLRADVFDDLLTHAEKTGALADNPVGLPRDLATFINNATGRGDNLLGIKLGGDVGKLLNGLFFSPRLMASRLTLLNPATYINPKIDPFVRKESIKSLLSFGAIASSVLGLASMAGADVESDPRSADFGKIKVGNTRYDIFGGFQQPVKLAAQLLTGEMKSTTTGKVATLGEGYGALTRKDILFRYFENKEAPVASFVTQLLEGHTGTGAKVDIPTAVVERFIPLILQDLYDIHKEGGSLLSIIPSIFGVGSQTYGNDRNANPYGLGGVLTGVENRIPKLPKGIKRNTVSKSTKKQPVKVAKPSISRNY